MHIGTRDDLDKLRRYVARLAEATERSELMVLLDLRALMDAVVPEPADCVAMRGCRRVRDAIDAEYDARFGIG